MTLGRFFLLLIGVLLFAALTLALVITRDGERIAAIGEGTTTLEEVARETVLEA